ncbi:formylglycine-generating enzyme family protein [Vibrio coralliirubri]|uniref:formylglycine-generating enzyme family protein n=1 Tax=Vibrio coralliirubri TaxID=1516159 RepID=UPI002284895A|nr:formylglycine-generating enzyme family protein [Vibrio coralliirubri]MCY9864942.1 formylglycine-generating enzyme family protein [Vibrio coralliirubri]
MNKSVLAAVLMSSAFGASALTLDKMEVSNAEYVKFMESNVDTETPRYLKEYRTDFFKKSHAVRVANFRENTFNKPDHPVVGVSWYAAKAFCEWRGGRLPTRKEWIALSGAKDTTWSWGSQWDYSMANTGGEFKSENDGFIYSAPVDSFHKGQSPTGILNLSGNVAEWTMDQKVVGGSSNSNPSGVAIQAYLKYEPEFRNFDIGFRCVQ